MNFRFGSFEFDAASGELRKTGRVVALEPQPSKALALLLARAGDVVSREELRDAVWGSETHVDFDRGIAYCLSQVRAALGDSANNPRFVQTIPKRGFKFIAPVAPSAAVVPAGHILPLPPAIPPPPFARWAAVMFLVLMAVAWIGSREPKPAPAASSQPVIIAVSIFDNETGLPEYDRLVAGLSDLVVARLASIDPDRMAVVGNAAVLRQPRNIRNLKVVAQALRADYVLLGQLQRGETGLRFITHFIRLRDEAHLKANRLPVADGSLAGLEDAVVAEFERAVRTHVP